MRAHAVGERLDQGRALAAPGTIERPLGDGLHGQHVVAVDPQARDAEARRAPVQRDARLHLDGLRDRPLVVLHEEHDRRMVAGREDERLAHVALAGRPVAEVDQHGAVVVGVVVADEAVALQPHRVARGVQRLGADDEGVEVEPCSPRIPVDHARAPERLEHVERVHPAHEGDGVLAVGGEHLVEASEGGPRADLGGLLPERRRPQAELSLALQRRGLGVEAAAQHHVAQVGRDGRVVVGVGEGLVVDALTVGGEQLDELLAPLDPRTAGSHHRLGRVRVRTRGHHHHHTVT